MRIARFEVNGTIRRGVVRDDTITEIEGDIFSEFEEASTTHQLVAVRLLVPIVPSQMYGPGVNFVDHLRPADGAGGQVRMVPTPQPWHKGVNALNNPGDAIVIPFDSANGIQYEGECLAVIGAPTRRVSPEEAWHRILGYTCGNDVSERNWQRNDNSYWRGKGSDTFAPVGPWIDTEFDPKLGGDMVVRVNGNEVQRANTANMHFDFGELISYISQQVTLRPGDIVWSGTTGRPENLEPGDTVEVEIESIGVLSNPVEAEPHQL